MIFPVDVTTSQLRAFFRLVHTTEGAAHVHTVTTKLRMDLTKLLPVLNAAEILGLVAAEKGEEAYKRGGRDAYEGSVKSSVDSSPCEKSVK